MADAIIYDFDWDAAKAYLNLTNHGVIHDALNEFALQRAERENRISCAAMMRNYL